MNLIVLLSVVLCNTIVFSQNVTHIKRRRIYDFIIVGGGTAGSVLATRLSEIYSWKILLLEAGGWNRLPNKIPAMAARYQGTSIDWHYKIQPQKNCCLGLKDEKLFWPAGKTLGGTSELNYMIYTRGNREDYDLWAKKGNPGWSYREVLPYFLKSENYRFKTFSNRYHNANGALSIEHPYTSNITDVFLDAAEELGYEILDYNGAKQIRFSKIKAHLHKGQRHSVLQAFLNPVRRQRENLTVAVAARVTKIITDGSKNAIGVTFERNGKTRRVFANKKVILSAGVVGTTKILLLSGIGPKEDLQKLQISLVQDLAVGQGIQDHISYFGLNYLTNNQIDFNYFSYITGIYSCIQKCIASSPLGIEAVGFVKLNSTEKNSDIPDVEILLANNLINRDLKFLTNMRDEVYQKCFQGVEDFAGANVFPILLHPKSKGFIKLRSKDSSVAPIIQPNYLSHKDDLKKMVESIRFVEKLMRTKKFANVDAALYPVPVCDKFEMYSEEYWECAVKTLTMSFNDYMGGCKMGPPSDKEAVVDSKLQVYGVKNLMVVDASVIPVTISGHVGATTIMIAEKAADIIKEKHGS